MSHLAKAAELIGLVYLALCLFTIGLFILTTLVTEAVWRRRQRKRAKTAYIRDWRIT